MKNIIFAFLLINPLFSIGQEDPGCYVKKYFLLIQSTKDYAAALQTAQQAEKALGIDLDLRGLVPVKDQDIGLSLPADTCMKYSEEEYGIEDGICYMARGRWDDGIYISIEYSNSYSGFSKGYYIVMVGSSNTKDKPLMAALEKAQQKYADAYIKTSTVYMCCVH